MVGLKRVGKIDRPRSLIHWTSHASCWAQLLVCGIPAKHFSIPPLLGGGRKGVGYP